MKLHSFTLLIGSCILLFSCNESKEKKEITKLVTEWQDKEIIFPEDLIFTRYGQDAIQYEMPESDYKILLYVDSIGCTSCKLQLHKWNEFIAQVDSLTSGSVPVLLFFHPKDKRELSYLLKRDGITIPVCLDENDRLNSINRFPSRDDFQCFLLDKDNKVVYIGNPIHNIRIREMYLSRIAPEAHTPTTPSRSTIVQADQTEFNLGTLKRGNSTTVTALIRNIGEVPLVVYDTKVSCGCTSINYKKEPALPGSSMEIEITYNAEDPGYFHRTVSIYGNMDNSPLMIRLKGNTN
ncbi:DUF1573 domain-containing protein [Proteiniphilum sp. X52]|uniref:DUF1573 domain-containing protein n=1 Tax=Proteiniphilum sp. X52 TaxID=2382159 RepID=UPI000F0A7A1E|nr:DUF1573 domain-containing protein [Proteiniphilum sp. X52]RNC63491.1 DUF1573 domain-containing protein [Proteiniphilum sp. X52]